MESSNKSESDSEEEEEEIEESYPEPEGYDFFVLCETSAMLLEEYRYNVGDT